MKTLPFWLRRHRGIGRLRPNVVLYGEENPNGDTIEKVAERDLRTGPDMVIVVGTGLKVPGAKRLVKEFCRSVKSRGGLAVWINKDPIPSGLKGCFGYFSKGLRRCGVFTFRMNGFSFK